MRIVGWTLTGAATGIVVGLVWHVFEPSLALYFWPVLGAVIFGQHAYRSRRNKDAARPPTRRGGG
jgi:hypothetical protein